VRCSGSHRNTTSPAVRPAATTGKPHTACRTEHAACASTTRPPRTIAPQPYPTSHADGVMHGTCHAGRGTMRANTLVDPRAQCLPSHCRFGVVLPAPKQQHLRQYMQNLTRHSAKLKRTGWHVRVSFARTFGRASDSSRASRRA
jgi:hypothetical protein